MTETPAPMVCDLTRLSGAERQRLESVVAELFPSAREVRGLVDGYALSFPDASAGTLAKLAEFIAYDRLCCAFLTHSLVSESAGGPTWLKITGGEGAREVIASDLKRLVSPDALVADPL